MERCGRAKKWRIANSQKRRSAGGGIGEFDDLWVDGYAKSGECCIRDAVDVWLGVEFEAGETRPSIERIEGWGDPRLWDGRDLNAGSSTAFGRKIGQTSLRMTPRLRCEL
jgi:hypothetical protein